MWHFDFMVLLSQAWQGRRGHGALTNAILSFGQEETFSQSPLPGPSPVACLTAGGLGSSLEGESYSCVLLISGKGSLEACRRAGIAITFGSWTYFL